MQTIKNKSFYPWLVWGLGATFFLAEYLARVAPAVMVPDLMRAFHITALQIGALSAFFYYAYLSMQVPVGTLVDRFGPHKLLTVTPLLCALGCFLFAMSHSAQMAELSRFLMGFGAAFAFVGTLKLATLWFPAERFGLLAGLTQALGMFGAALGEGPSSLLVGAIGWQNTMISIGVILLLLAVLIGIVVRDRPQTAVKKETTGLLKAVILVLKNPQSWIISLFSGLLYAPTAAFAELWGVSYLARVHELNAHVAAMGISFIFIGWGLGSPILGWISDRAKVRRPALFFSVIASLILMLAILYVPIHSTLLLFALLFSYGVANTGVATSYAVASEINPHPIAGTSIAFTNMASVLVGALFQPIIGWILDLKWDGQMADGVRIYSAHAFNIAMIALPACLILGLVVTFFIRETHCRNIVCEKP
jgi:sugar phosphate permease